MIRVTIDRVMVEGLALSEKEIRARLERALSSVGTDSVITEREVVMAIREAFDA